MSIKHASWPSPSNTFTFIANDLSDAMEAAMLWLRTHDNPVNVTVTVQTHRRPTLVDSVDWEVKIISWAGWETPAIPI
jgi:hypothetical protein